MSDSKKPEPKQLELPLGSGSRTQKSHTHAGPVARVPPPRTLPREQAPRFQVIRGEGRKGPEALVSRDAVVRVLLEAGADVLLRRISPVRAEEIERRVDQILALFDQVDAHPEWMSLLKKHLDELEALMTETRAIKEVGRLR